MKVEAFKDLGKVSLLVSLSILLLVAPSCCAEAENEAKANLTKSGSSNSPGLEQIKPLAPGKENSPASEEKQDHEMDQADLKQKGEPSSEMKKEENEDDEENVAGIHENINSPSKSKAKENGSQKKVNHEPESRSNLTSPSEVHGEVASDPGIPMKIPLFHTDQKLENKAQGNNPHSGDPLTSRKNASEEVKHSGESEAIHEHVEKYQIHQAEEDEAEEEQELKELEKTHPGLRVQGDKQGSEADSVVVMTDSVPIRAGPNTRLGGNFNSNLGHNGVVRRPIPVLRRDQFVGVNGGDHF